MTRLTTKRPTLHGACYDRWQIMWRAIDILAGPTESHRPSTYQERHPDVQAALTLCRRCDIQEACLRWAIDTHEPHGVVGGTVPRQRNQRKRR